MQFKVLFTCKITGIYVTNKKCFIFLNAMFIRSPCGLCFFLLLFPICIIYNPLIVKPELIRHPGILTNS